MQRRGFLKAAGWLASGSAVGLPQVGSAAEASDVPEQRTYSHHGRPDDYTEFRVIEPGRVIQKIETFNQGMFAIVRVTTGDGITLKADANSGFTPPRAIAIGRLMEDQAYDHYAEPCPSWELEWTADVAAALSIPVAGGDQDHDLAPWRRMIRMNAVDIVQPDVLYLGGDWGRGGVQPVAERR